VAEPEDAAEATLPAKMQWDQFRALLNGAEGGDRASLDRLREVLKSDAHPSWTRWFVETFGDPPTWLKNELSRAVGGKKNLAVDEAVMMRLDQIRKDLEGEQPTPIEKVLAGRAALCWFIVHFYETSYMQAENLTIQQSDFQQRRIDAAHRRFLSAVATLARVRKMALPSLQVNIGTNQINVARGVE
jgi:hypothetical protein